MCSQQEDVALPVEELSLTDTKSLYVFFFLQIPLHPIHFQFLLFHPCYN